MEIDFCCRRQLKMYLTQSQGGSLECPPCWLKIQHKNWTWKTLSIDIAPLIPRRPLTWQKVIETPFQYFILPETFIFCCQPISVTKFYFPDTQLLFFSYVAYRPNMKKQLAIQLILISISYRLFVHKNKTEMLQNIIMSSLVTQIMATRAKFEQWNRGNE